MPDQVAGIKSRITHAVTRRESWHAVAGDNEPAPAPMGYGSGPVLTAADGEIATRASAICRGLLTLHRPNKEARMPGSE